MALVFVYCAVTPAGTLCISPSGIVKLLHLHAIDRRGCGAAIRRLRGCDSGFADQLLNVLELSFELLGLGMLRGELSASLGQLKL